MQSWPETLPLRYDVDCQYGEEDEDDVLFDNGEVWFHGTIIGNELHIHELVAKDRNKQKARTGVGRRAMEEIRPYFEIISPRQVATDLREQPDAEILDHQAFLFWRAMLVDGLVDVISVGYDQHQITRDNLMEQQVGSLGTFIPGEGLSAPATGHMMSA